MESFIACISVQTTDTRDFFSVEGESMMHSLLIRVAPRARVSITNFNKVLYRISALHPPVVIHAIVKDGRAPTSIKYLPTLRSPALLGTQLHPARAGVCGENVNCVVPYSTALHMM